MFLSGFCCFYKLQQLHITESLLFSMLCAIKNNDAWK
nr:MAG TPA: Pre-mRNA-splicing factor 38A-splicing, RNA BINDING PROTEIN.28A [Caudoviricetes sp.]DAL98765.1 MAG TPA: Pre-mRNA-splicing factor 38A-splicing, RNA BINDING PROTEIN.28A [Caudoviricetes sp.]